MGESRLFRSAVALWLVMATIVCTAAETPCGIGLGYPVPRQVVSGDAVLDIPEDFTINAPRELFPVFADLNEQFSAIGVRPRHAGKAAAFLRLEIDAERTPEHPQGYLLEVGEGYVSIASRTPAGLFNGLQTFRMMLLAAKRTALPQCRIADWPSLERRGIAFSIHRVPRQRLGMLKKQLCVLAALKYNRVMIEFGDNFPYASHQFPARRDNFTERDIADLVGFAQARFIEVVPMLRIVAGCPLVSERSDVERMLENPHGGRYSPYCPLKPAVSALLKAAIGEQCASLRPRSFVFYLDRKELLQNFRRCDECRKHSAVELISGHLRFLAAECAAYGVNAEFVLSGFDRSTPLPDILSALGEKSRVVLAGTSRQGMDGAASIGSGNAIRVAAAAAAAAGGKEFTLLGFESTDQGRIVPLKNASPWFYGDVVNAASALWNPANARCPDDPVALFFRLFRPTPEVPVSSALPIPLDDAFTAELSQGGSFPSYRDRQTLAALCERLAARPEMFRLATAPGPFYHN